MVIGILQRWQVCTFCNYTESLLPLVLCVTIYIFQRFTLDMPLHDSSVLSSEMLCAPFCYFMSDFRILALKNWRKLSVTIWEIDFSVIIVNVIQPLYICQSHPKTSPRVTVFYAAKSAQKMSNMHLAGWFVIAELFGSNKESFELHFLLIVVLFTANWTCQENLWRLERILTWFFGS